MFIKDEMLLKEKISDVLLEVINKFSKVDRKKRDYGIGEPLFHSEIRTLCEIKEHEDIHISALAEQCGVTKGAISQVLKKLEKKGVITKQKDIRNQSRILLKLTPKGETAYLHYLDYHNQFKKMVIDILQGASMEKVAFAKDFLGKVEEKL